jgi:transcriptional regulator with XRE-family HTH domain
MKTKSWSQADLARASGLNRQVISSYINQRRLNPEPDALVAIARGLNVSPVIVFRKAGLLPEGGENLRFEDWQYLISQLSPEDEEELRRIAEMKIERKKKEKGLKALKPRKVG